jgi:hypothetical protein
VTPGWKSELMTRPLMDAGEELESRSDMSSDPPLVTRAPPAWLVPDAITAQRALGNGVKPATFLGLYAVTGSPSDGHVPRP